MWLPKTNNCKTEYVKNSSFIWQAGAVNVLTVNIILFQKYFCYFYDYDYYYYY